jgi:hypothetical protein
LGRPWLGTQEFPLFTDAWIDGEINLGPYGFLNARASPTAGTVRPGIVLRYAIHKEFDYSDLKKTDAEQYHGGTVQEELAALASLAMGIRLRAGMMTRSFEPGGDPLGRPDHFGVFFAPQVNIEFIPVLPGAFGKHKIDALNVLQQVTLMEPTKAMALVRAARLYQDALWLVESVPELAWLLLVSALEVAANDWQKASGDSVARLNLSKPDLYSFLERLPDSSILPKVASYDGRQLELPGVLPQMEMLPDP